MYQFDAILGMDWLSKFKCILDCTNHTCKVSKGTITHMLSLKHVLNQVSSTLHMTYVQLQKQANTDALYFMLRLNLLH
jgi:Retroviral aspartyl protease